MTRTKPTESKSKYVVAAVLLILFMPLLYFLSLGPVVWLADQGYLSESVMETVELIYRPMEWLVANSEVARGIIMFYVELFR